MLFATFPSATLCQRRYPIRLWTLQTISKCPPLLSNLRRASNFSDHPRQSAAGSSSHQGTMVGLKSSTRGWKTNQWWQSPPGLPSASAPGRSHRLSLSGLFLCAVTPIRIKYKWVPSKSEGASSFSSCVWWETKSSRNSRCANRAATHLHRRRWLWARTAAGFDLSGKSAVRAAAQNPETGKLAGPSLTLTRLRPRNRHNWSGNPREIVKTLSWPFQRDFAYLSRGQHDAHSNPRSVSLP